MSRSEPTVARCPSFKAFEGLFQCFRNLFVSHSITAGSCDNSQFPAAIGLLKRSKIDSKKISRTTLRVGFDGEQHLGLPSRSVVYANVADELKVTTAKLQREEISHASSLRLLHGKDLKNTEDLLQDRHNLFDTIHEAVDQCACDRNGKTEGGVTCRIFSKDKTSRGF